MACRVFIEPTLENYNKKKDEIGLKEELTTEKSKEYKERFPFMNWSSDSSKKLLIKYLKPDKTTIVSVSCLIKSKYWSIDITTINRRSHNFKATFSLFSWVSSLLVMFLLDLPHYPCVFVLKYDFLELWKISIFHHIQNSMLKWWSHFFFSAFHHVFFSSLSHPFSQSQYVMHFHQHK